MNFRGGFALIRRTMFGFMAEKGFFWTLALGWMMGPAIYMFVWTVAAGDGSITGFTQQDFVRYYILLILVNQLTYPTSHWTVGDQIYGGKMSIVLLRPISPFYDVVASDLAVKIVCMPFVIFIAGMAAIFMNFRLAISGLDLLVAVYLLLMAQIIRFMLAYTLSLFAFFTNKISSLLAINDTLVFLLAGQVAPSSLLPGFMQKISDYLPFQYMISFPIEFALGKLDRSQLLFGVIVQLVWAIVIIICNRIVWKKGIRAYMAVGG
ncbi:ABC transporter permease [Paenibacillus sp. CN-4]|uniref:ABC transporter permease n=1 Tax=Paenibacillus nanchangensis TaxID=3348343 RepID=UPI00397E9079